jgi:hypothetical protein
MRRVPVESSVIDSVGYENEVLEIRFKSDALYRYFGVPSQVWLDLLEADSKGSFFNRRIRDAYRYERLATARSR